MKKYSILSVNDNPKYLFYVPLVVWAWRHQGWEPIIFFHGKRNELTAFIQDIHDKVLNEGMTAEMKQSLYRLNIEFLNDVEGCKSETITQVSRLYGACVVDGQLMTSDVDMIPLSNYWQPEDNKITCYGRNLSDEHQPICYVSMCSDDWAQLMYVSNNDFNSFIARDLNRRVPRAKNVWCVDQDLLTENLRLLPEFIKKKVVNIDRPIDNRTGYPIGRVDRSAWSLNHSHFIDCHAPHDILTNEASFKKVMELLHTVWPKEDWKWFINYYKEFKKLCQNK